MVNKITTLFDLDSKGFDTGLKALRTRIGETDGALGKLKVGAQGAFAALGASAGFAAIAIGTTLVAASVKAVGTFVDMSKAAIDGANATGLNTEAMSRWIAVAEDMRVGSDQLVTGFGRIAKTLDSGKWEQYGIATRDAGGNVRDVNDILLDTFDVLAKTTNEGERATIGAALFGKGFANIAPLVGKTRAEYEGYLAAVEDGQVITADESKKAEDARLALDELHDAMQEVGLAAGEVLAPALTVVADDLAGIAQAAAGAVDEINKIPGLPKVLSYWNPVTGFAGGIAKGVKAALQEAHALWDGDSLGGASAPNRGRGGVASLNPVAPPRVIDRADNDRLRGAAIAARDTAAADKLRADAADRAALADQNAADALARRQAGLHDYQRASLDVGDAEARLADARDRQNRLLTEGKVTAAEKASADRDIAEATKTLLDAQSDLNRVVASSIPTDEDKAQSLRKVEDAARDLEDATRGVASAEHAVEQSERRLADLRGQLAEVNGPQFTDATVQTEAFKNAKKQADLDKKRADLTLDIADAEYNLEGAHRSVDDATQNLTDAQDKLNEAQDDNARLMRDGINVDDQKRAALDRVAAAESRLGDAQRARTQLTADSIPTDADKAQATRDVERAQLDVISALEGQAAAFAAQKGAADDSTTSLALQRQELQRIIDMQPELANALQPNIDLLNARGGGPVYSQMPAGARGDGPSVVVNFNGVVGDPVAVGHQVVDATNAWYRAGGYGAINPFALTGPR